MKDVRSSALEWLLCLKESGVPLADGEMLQRLAEVAGELTAQYHATLP